LACVLEVGRAVASGLAAAHARGLIHCDVKPANLWLEKPPECAENSGADAEVGRVKLLDFGIVRTAGADSIGTAFGHVLGTPDYMAPERLCGAALDGRCDLYSLGCVLYEMCTGRTPFGGGTKEEVLTRVLHDLPSPVRDDNPAVPPALADLIHQLLAKSPQDRPASATEVERAIVALGRTLSADTTIVATVGDATTTSLSAARPADRRTSRWRRVAWVAAAAVLLLGITAWLARGPATTSPKIAPPPSGPVGDAWLDYVRALTAEQQMAAVTAKLAELNPDFSGKVDYFRVENGMVADLRFLTDDVEDVTPLRALRSLRTLDCRGSLPGKGRLADITPLTGMSLEALWCSNNPITDLSPLHADRDLTAGKRSAPWERGMPLAELHASHTAITTLTELRGISLGLLVISGTAVRDLEPLRHMPLYVLHCEGCPIGDLSPLQQTPLRVLHADIDPRRDRVLLVGMKSLQEINHRYPNEFWRNLQ
jgi:eukaryotic-like serine/threonine-protein kinase